MAVLVGVSAHDRTRSAHREAPRRDSGHLAWYLATSFVNRANDATDQPAGVERLLDVVLGAELEGEPAMLLFGPTGEDDDRNVGELGVALSWARTSAPSRSGSPEVEEDGGRVPAKASGTTSPRSSRQPLEPCLAGEAVEPGVRDNRRLR